MARRSDHTRTELKDLALKAGAELIENKGFSGFSARAVASKIGYTVGTLYHVFGSLEEFILHINGQTLDLFYQELSKAVESDKAQQIHALAKAHLDFCEINLNRWVALFEFHLPPEMEIPEWYMEKMSALFELVEQALLPYTNKNRRKAKRAAKILWASIHGLCMLAFSGKLDVVKAEPARVLAKDLVNNFLAGLKRGV